MKNAIPWILLFLVCLGVGFLHGVRPQNFSKSAYFATDQIAILTTDELLFSEELRDEILKKYNVTISLKITNNWDQYVAHTVSQDSVDLLLIPLHWAQSLHQQNLLHPLGETNLLKKIAPDFLKINVGLSFLPLFWMKTGFSPSDLSFADFLSDTKKEHLYLFADEDLILNHCLNWKKNNLLNQVSKKKLHFMPLTNASSVVSDKGLIEVSTSENPPNAYTNNSSLLIFGAAIPLHSSKKQHALNVLKFLASDTHIENKVLNSPFNSTYETLSNESIPLTKRAQNIRNLSFQNTTILDKKTEKASQRIRDECGIIYNP